MSMSRILIGLVLLVTLAGPIVVGDPLSIAAQEASPAAGTPAAATEADLLREIERERLRSLVAADMAGADEVYAADFQHISPSGLVVTREHYLGRIMSGVHDYQILEPASEMRVRLYGDGAVITYQSKVDLVSNGNHITGHGWHTEVYEKHDGRWLIVWSQTTQIQE